MKKKLSQAEKERLKDKERIQRLEEEARIHEKRYGQKLDTENFIYSKFYKRHYTPEEMAKEGFIKSVRNKSNGDCFRVEMILQGKVQFPMIEKDLIMKYHPTPFLDYYEKVLKFQDIPRRFPDEDDE